MDGACQAVEGGKYRGGWPTTWTLPPHRGQVIVPHFTIARVRPCLTISSDPSGRVRAKRRLHRGLGQRMSLAVI